MSWNSLFNCEKNKNNKINILMVGVDDTSVGGMLTIARYYQFNEFYNDKVELYYVGTAIRKNKVKKILFFIKAILKVIFILFTKRIDIVHIHMAEKTSTFRKYIVMRLGHLFGSKVMVQLHAGPFMKWYETLEENKKNFVKKVVNEPDKLLVLGQYWVEPISLIANKEKLSVLYNGVEVPDKNIYNIKAKDISFFALLKTTKGIKDLLDAVDAYKEQIPLNTKIHLCGVSDEFDVKEYIQKRHIEDMVICHGWVEGKAKEEIYSKTALNVLPTYSEGLSMTVLESMAYGIPMITTDVTTMPELLSDIVELVKPGDVNALGTLMVRLLKDDAIRQEISEREYSRVLEKFSVEQMIKNTLKLYDELLK